MVTDAIYAYISMGVLYQILHMYAIAQHSPNHLYYVHKSLFRDGGKATFAFRSEKSPPPPF